MAHAAMPEKGSVTETYYRDDVFIAVVNHYMTKNPKFAGSNYSMIMCNFAPVSSRSR
jgi:hypothetical protein